MKKGIVIVLIAVFPLLGFSQSVFDKFEEMDHVASVTINKGLINMLSNIQVEGDEDVEEFIEMAKGVNGIKVFVTEDSKVSTDMRATVKKYLKSSSLEELMRVRAEEANIKFYVKNGKDDNHVAELLMFVSGMKNTDLDINGRKFETVLVSMTGDIDLRKIGSLTKSFDLPKELNKAEKGK